MGGTKHILSIPFESNTTGNTNGNKPTRQNPQESLLLSITNPSSSSSSSSSSTDPITELTFQGTDGETAFSGTLPASRLSKVLLKDAGLSVSQFEIVLRHVFLQRPHPESSSSEDFASASSLENISLTAVGSADEGSKTSSSTIRLRFRREVGGINHYIAEIPLHRDDSTEIDVCEWTRLAIEHGSAAKQEAGRLRARLRETKLGVEKIKLQLEELLKVKGADEVRLLERFTKVLNAKKERIRILESASGRGTRPWPAVVEKEEDDEDEDDVEVKDEDKGTASGTSRGKGNGKGKGKGKAKAKGKTAGPSRMNKRKQPAATQTESEPAFESMHQHQRNTSGEDKENNEDEQENRAQEDIETDRESLEEDLVMLDQDDDARMIDGGSDDLDAATLSSETHPNRRSDPNAMASSSKVIPASKPQSGNSKQHALRTRQIPPLEDTEDQSTDDEL